MPNYPLSAADFATVIRLAPLVSIDLIIRNPKEQVLLGLRNYEPARGMFFVPGGIIRKEERLRDAFARIMEKETSCIASIDDARLLGVYEHLYPNNRLGDPHYGTHYVVLAHEIKFDDDSNITADDQHSRYVWWDEAKLLAAPDVHDYTKAYFR